MQELVLDTSLREAAALVGLGHEAMRKFVNGTTDRPHQRSLRSMGNLYLERRAGGVAEVRTAVPSAPHLKLLFAPGLENATGEVQALFDDWREGRAPPALAAELERWLIAKLREEYAAEPSWAPTRKRSRR
jgi:hypothetical protein